MGFVRTFLAIAVVLGHSTPIHGYFGISADVAVRIFFMVSGFYMSLIISEKYTGKVGLRAFYVGRFLRIFPIYYAALLFTILVYYGIGDSSIAGIKGWDFVESRGVSLIEGVAWILPNLVLFGSDLPFLFHHDFGLGTFFTFGGPTVASSEAVRISPSIFIGPAWTLGNEIWFYLLVPFLAKVRNFTLLGLASSSMVVLVCLEIWQPWSSYFFFPANLCFFLIGMTCQRICRSDVYQKFHVRMPERIVTTVVILALGLLVFRQYIPFYRNYSWMVYAFVSVCLPVLFTATKNSKFDRWIGGLSYPIYILHAPILWILEAATGSITGRYTLPATFVISVLIVLIMDAPLEKWRQTRVRNILFRNG
jgi:peptidoglycan/LPS O-acetylase OafA/YrhL